ncbi:hypothetical protein JB92DRAFT_2829451 [Gautieria morchelliformis]|nr:hypothetical protein JB92DRAFT_2829451 [Gautieria morchelliformis]
MSYSLVVMSMTSHHANHTNPNLTELSGLPQFSVLDDPLNLQEDRAAFFVDANQAMHSCAVEVAKTHPLPCATDPSTAQLICSTKNDYMCQHALSISDGQIPNSTQPIALSGWHYDLQVSRVSFNAPAPSHPLTAAISGKTQEELYIDGEQLHGKEYAPGTLHSVAWDGFAEKLFDLFTFDITWHPWWCGTLFDAIVTDPPYSI